MLADKLQGYRIILASKSPRRKLLLSGLEINFETSDLHSVDETWPDGLDKFQIPVWLSELKSRAYPEDLTGKDILITADTIVWFEEEVIHKPVDREDALFILDRLQGNTHEVITGVTVRSRDLMTSFCSHSEVTFSSLCKSELEYYVDRFEPYDKAGGYGIQEWIGYVGIKEIHGSYFNVMGLPVQKLYNVLCTFVETLSEQGL